jgi:VIT1/CCC1 family predicted Fe2+/Mn2+ transporter
VAYGLPEGAKALADSLNASRGASKELSNSIEGIQRDGIEVAKQQAQERRIAARQAEVKKELAIHKALAEYRHRKLITAEEYKLKTEFVKQYGSKDWEEVLKIKNELEKLEKIEKKQYDDDLKKVRYVQFWCFLAAVWIAWYLTWGIKE